MSTLMLYNFIRVR